MTVALSKAVEDGAKAVICASTGNTSASAAAYAARAGIVCAVLVPRGQDRARQAGPGAWCTARNCCRSTGTSTTAWPWPRTGADYPVALVNSVNPYRIEGQKTAAFEIVDALGDAPDIHCLPVGNAGNITAYWKGYSEDEAAGKASHRPRMFGFQASEAAPIVRGEVVRNPQTIATAIRIGNPASWTKAVDARDQSGGLIDAVTDRAILAAYRLLARTEGVFVELASAASVAGLLQSVEQGLVARGQTIVCTVTGHGLKDPDWAVGTAPAPTTIAVDPHAAAVALGLV